MHSMQPGADDMARQTLQFHKPITIMYVAGTLGVASDLANMLSCASRLHAAVLVSDEQIVDQS